MTQIYTLTHWHTHTHTHTHTQRYILCLKISLFFFEVSPLNIALRNVRPSCWTRERLGTLRARERERTRGDQLAENVAQSLGWWWHLIWWWTRIARVSWSTGGRRESHCSSATLSRAATTYFSPSTSSLLYTHTHTHTGALTHSQPPTYTLITTLSLCVGLFNHFRWFSTRIHWNWCCIC